MMYQANAPLFGPDDRLAKLLMAQQPDYSSMKQSPLQGLAAALGQIGGAYMAKKNDTAERKEAMKTYQDAMGVNSGTTPVFDPNTKQWSQGSPGNYDLMGKILMQSEKTAPLAERMMGGQLDAQMGLQNKIAEMKALMPYEIQLARAKAAASAQGGGAPAPVQIADKIMGYLSAAKNAKTPEERDQYIFQANLLSQSAKMYDKGLNAFGAGGTHDISQLPGYGATLGQIGQTKKGMEEQGKVEGQAQGEHNVAFDEFMAVAPGLNDVGNQLYTLADAATYTKTGKGRDFFLREMGFDPGDSAAAAAKVATIIDTEILPLLKPTFGAQFTVKEGEWLRATMGNQNLAPREKKAQLEARMAGWQRQAENLARQAKKEVPGQLFGIQAPQAGGETKVIGGKTYVKQNGQWYEQ